MIINKIGVSFSGLNYLKFNNNNSFNYQSNPMSQDVFVKSSGLPNTNKVAFAGGVKPLSDDIDFDAVEKLTEHLARRPFSKKHNVGVYKRYPASQGISGDLPPSWLAKVDSKDFDKNSFCKELGKIITEDRHDANIDVMKNSLRNLFITHGIMTEDDNFEVDFVGKGFFGRGFKITINDDAKLLKEYKRTYRYHNNHGNLSEQNLGEHIRKYSHNFTNMAPYYYGDSKNGFMICEFIYPDTPLPKIEIPHEDLFQKYGVGDIKSQKIEHVDLDDMGMAYDDDKPRNIVGDYYVDFGGLITINNLVGKPIAQNIYKTFKYNSEVSPELKMELFNKIFNDDDQKTLRERMVGLTHSIKYLPEEVQADYYNKMHSLHDVNVDIAIVESSDNRKWHEGKEALLEDISKSENENIHKAISRKIKNFPTALQQKLFMELADSPNQSVKKYLARNLNYYFEKPENRIIIFDKLAKNADSYAHVALTNALEWLSAKNADKNFEYFYNTNDIITQCALARSLYLFNEEPALLNKWTNKLLEIEDFRVKRALAEMIPELSEHKDLVFDLFADLLDVQDNNTKEFLAEGITYVQGFMQHPDWVSTLLKNSDNTIRRSLANQLPKITSPFIRERWEKLILNGADSSVKKIIEKQNTKKSYY